MLLAKREQADSIITSRNSSSHACSLPLLRGGKTCLLKIATLAIAEFPFEIQSLWLGSWAIGSPSRAQRQTSFWSTAEEWEPWDQTVILTVGSSVWVTGTICSEDNILQRSVSCRRVCQTDDCFLPERVESQPRTGPGCIEFINLDTKPFPSRLHHCCRQWPHGVLGSHPRGQISFVCKLSIQAKRCTRALQDETYTLSWALSNRQWNKQLLCLKAFQAYS